jgi:carbon-monoxide dehydrogenase medium subunit
LERDGLVRRVPLLQLALPFVGHRELRNRGTVCGSVAHADPAAEIPAVAACLDATAELTGPEGTRTVPVRELLTGPLATSLGPAEVLTALRLPVAGTGDGYGFAEVARRHGDFALAGCAAAVRVDGGRVQAATVTAFGVAATPAVRTVTAELGAVADAGPVQPERLSELGEQLADLVTTGGDAHASADYRRRLVRALSVRCLADAYRRATGTEEAA